MKDWTIHLSQEQPIGSVSEIEKKGSFIFIENKYLFILALNNALD